MADLKIADDVVTNIKKGLSEVQSSLDATEDFDFEASKSNVGQGDMITAVNHFVERMARFKNKYNDDISNFTSFLDNVLAGSDEVDTQIAQALNVEEQKTTV